MATGGKRGTMTLVRQQMIRLFSATIAIVQNKSTPNPNPNQSHEPLAIDRVGYLLADQLSTWWDPMQPGQGSMFESFVVLSEPFFNELVNRPVPVDMRALKALKQSPFALDVYSWLTYRFSPSSAAPKSRGRLCRCNSVPKPKANGNSVPYSAKH